MVPNHWYAPLPTGSSFTRFGVLQVSPPSVLRMNMTSRGSVGVRTEPSMYSHPADVGRPSIEGDIESGVVGEHRPRQLVLALEIHAGDVYRSVRPHVDGSPLHPVRDRQRVLKVLTLVDGSCEVLRVRRRSSRRPGLIDETISNSTCAVHGHPLLVTAER